MMDWSCLHIKATQYTPRLSNLRSTYLLTCPQSVEYRVELCIEELRHEEILIEQFDCIATGSASERDLDGNR